ncbi:ran guanine nucleotide release factor-like [Ylistrum balloti]|uniref:ran guanine nucleotide release factor-like n=1 Tax=Ylistrum balloti TaxID=509963 RepID=UPI002905EFFE|nr:ran guanine nucleotide release factor-like [Ylistrum balloti]XP_060073466.1 ran guanine nucleotide release factor-like [Ylistrum balloti]XP_060073467.1 ran guanine nucleotide release factor-like [Ylistrum balloti]XP_060073468.1 ran guanine nucleotide release factor-like [Ylistrum balloti]
MSAMDQSQPPTNLFGGAMSAVFPPDAQDMSKFREIPDHQEVFTHSTTDQSIIIEILEYVQEPDDVALKTHYDDLVRDNEVSEGDHVILEAEEIPVHKLAMSQCESARYVLGQQKVSKFKEDSKNTINIHMGLFRIPEFTSDILVTFNDPVMISFLSSSNQAVPTNSNRWTVEKFQKLLTSLTINDTGLFGAE